MLTAQPVIWPCEFVETTIPVPTVAIVFVIVSTPSEKENDVGAINEEDKFAANADDNWNEPDTESVVVYKPDTVVKSLPW
jgi:hypothetical protein